MCTCVESISINENYQRSCSGKLWFDYELCMMHTFPFPTEGLFIFRSQQCLDGGKALLVGGPASLSKIKVGYFLGWFDDSAPPILKYIWHDGFDVIFGFRHLSFSFNILMNCFIKEICRCKRNLCKCWWTSLFVYEIQNLILYVQRVRPWHPPS